MTTHSTYPARQYTAGQWTANWWRLSTAGR